QSRGSVQHRPRRRTAHLTQADGNAVQGVLRPLSGPPAGGILMGAPYLTSQVLDDPRIRHGFFGRAGGRSQGDLASNNLPISAGENIAFVTSTRWSAATARGAQGIRARVVLRRVPSTPVATLPARPAAGVAIEADAMVTNRSDLLLGILTADCSPVLLAD